MAEYHVSPAQRLHKLPANMSDEEGALVEPVSVAYHSIWGRGGGVAPHDTVAVFGAGPIGLFAIQVAKVAGARVIVVEPMPSRQRMAREIGGADEIVDPSAPDFLKRMSELTSGLGCSLVVECSGSKAGIAATVEVAGVHGRIVLTGQAMGVQIPAELGKMIWKHATIAGSCGSPYFFPKTILYMSRGPRGFQEDRDEHLPARRGPEGLRAGEDRRRAARSCSSPSQGWRRRADARGSRHAARAAAARDGRKARP